MLRANDLIWGYMVSNYLLGKDPFPFDLLYWNADSTAMPARAHRFYLQEFYIRDAFAKGEFKVGDTPITLGDIKGPVYHVATKEDHIAPGRLGLSRRQGDDPGRSCASCSRAPAISPAWSIRRCSASTSSGPTPT